MRDDYKYNPPWRDAPYKKTDLTDVFGLGKEEPEPVVEEIPNKDVLNDFMMKTLAETCRELSLTTLEELLNEMRDYQYDEGTWEEALLFIEETMRRMAND